MEWNEIYNVEHEDEITGNWTQFLLFWAWKIVVQEILFFAAPSAFMPAAE